MKMLGCFNFDYSAFKVTYWLSLCHIIGEDDEGCTYAEQLDILGYGQVSSSPLY